jgi:NO-binding membrane sensor protein with MHYT domain
MANQEVFHGCPRLQINRMLVYVVFRLWRINEVNSSAKSTHFLLTTAFQRGFSIWIAAHHDTKSTDLC